MTIAFNMHCEVKFFKVVVTLVRIQLLKDENLNVQYCKCGYDFTPIRSFTNAWRFGQPWSGLPRAKAMDKDGL